ncbi:GGDEF domain-containing protein [Micromonospora sp. 4G55]|uniref:GGDEF domain-containing protein n=1 Tax=Micromonospora sp. 4G55 TaxID=2806102 RepID=UPI001A4AF745|nr:GGDEF domain-containing protein [Micromonospora sp. 4G55]MBM0255851.1 GGDEF domain-containing protein [Micromonospora sp. 4G55]
MSSILHTIAIAAGGVLAGLALSGALLWRQQQALAVARYEATHDEITGLPNRRLFLTRLRAALGDTAPVGLVLLDLDRFKTVNDTLGHDTGNVLLDQVGRLLAGLPAPVQVAARLSGDEFALLVSGDHEDTAAAAHAAWQVIAAAPIRVVNGDISVPASVGHTHTRGQHASPRQLLAEADTAMYDAKRSGGGVCEYCPRGAPPQRRSRDRHYH